MNSEETVKLQADVIEDTDTQLTDTQLDDTSLEEVVGGAATYNPNGQPSRVTVPFQD